MLRDLKDVHCASFAWSAAELRPIATRLAARSSGPRSLPGLPFPNRSVPVRGASALRDLDGIGAPAANPSSPRVVRPHHDRVASAAGQSGLRADSLARSSDAPLRRAACGVRRHRERDHAATRAGPRSASSDQGASTLTQDQQGATLIWAPSVAPHAPLVAGRRFRGSTVGALTTRGGPRQRALLGILPAAELDRCRGPPHSRTRCLRIGGLEFPDEDAGRVRSVGHGEEWEHGGSVGAEPFVVAEEESPGDRGFAAVE